MNTDETITECTQEQGFEVFRLRNSCVEITVIPELGARIVSLKNIRTGREWMWHPATGLKLFKNRIGDPFAASTLAGWDECLPTIAPCVWKQRILPDHGEVWSAAWSIDREAFKRGILKTSICLPISSFNFERAIELRGSRIRVEYTLTNVGSGTEEFLWAMHPLLAVRDGDQLELTGECRRRLVGESWIGSLDFGATTPACAKVFAGPIRDGRAGVFNPLTGDRLSLEWSTEECDTLGLWLTRGGWNDHHHLALEPTNGEPDSLADAARKPNRCGALLPQCRKYWTVQMRVGP